MRSQKNANKTGLFFSPNCKCFSNKTEYVQNRVRVFRIKRTEGFNFTGVTFTIGECFRTTRYAKQQKCYFSVKKNQQQNSHVFQYILSIQERWPNEVRKTLEISFAAPYRLPTLQSKNPQSREFTWQFSSLPFAINRNDTARRRRGNGRFFHRRQVSGFPTPAPAESPGPRRGPNPPHAATGNFQSAR